MALLNRAQGRHPVPWARRLPRKMTVDVRLRHACHVKRRWMSPSATPATQSAAASRATKPGPRAPPSTMSATPVTQNQDGCEIAPRLPRETKVDVTKCHACHAKCRGVTRKGGALGPGLVARDAAALCVAGVALGDIHLRFTWQAWRNLTSTVILRGRRRAHGTGWRPWARFSCAWRRGTLRGRRGTWWHPPSFHVAGVAQSHIHLGFAWQAWRSWYSVAPLGPV